MRWYRWLTWIVVGTWFGFCLLTLNYNGPFFDEAIYITAGQRTWQGFGYSDGYMGWFAGSLLWPALAAVGYRVAGLVGTRAVALLLAAAGVVAVVKATDNLFGPRAAFWATLALALNGPLLALARLGVYDAPALAGVTVAFWAITELARRDQRIWLGVAAVALMLGFFAKYPAGVMLLPLLGVLFFLRRKKALMDTGIFGFICLAILLAFLLPAREQVAALVAWQAANRPVFGVSRAMILAGILYAAAIPTVFAGAGWFVAREKRGVATILLLNLAIWPIYHLASGNPVSVNKHLVFSFALAYPLVGLALSAWWDGLRRTIVRTSSSPAPGEGGFGKPARRILPRLAVVGILLLLGAYAGIQLRQSDNSWPDSRPAADYLAAHVQPGQKLLINEAWPYTMYLYSQGRIASPWDVYDFYRITHSDTPLDFCGYDWFVDSQGSFSWPQVVSDTIAKCGNYREVFITTSDVIALGTDLNYVRYPVQVVLWQREGGGQ